MPWPVPRIGVIKLAADTGPTALGSGDWGGRPKVEERTSDRPASRILKFSR